MKVLHIESEEGLRGYLRELEESRTGVIAMDLEGEFNLHCYGERLCLVQVFDGANLAAIDPFSVAEETIRRLFENRDILKLVFDASSDLSLLENSRRTRIAPILDLSVAAAILDYKPRDLHSVLARALGVSLDKKSKYQKLNWTRRPLEKGAVEYALNDVRYLFELRDELMKQLGGKNKLDEFELRNLNVQNKNYRIEPEDRHTRLKGYKFLATREKNRLKELFAVRDEYARRLNWPAHNVIANPDLLDLAKGRLDPGRLVISDRLGAELREALLIACRRVIGHNCS